MPLAPTEPISSLSTSRHTLVYSGAPSISSIALYEGYAHTLSSCPYDRIILRSNPSSLALPAGTISNSAEIKSSSSIPYSFERIARTPFFTASFSSDSNGMLPTKRSRFSPSITLPAFFSICSPAKWIKRSDTQNTGSSSFSPIWICTLLPSFLTTTPWIAKGKVTHWYFLIPP